MINSNFKILGITLARGGSKSIPGKNIANVAGKPLISYTIEEALKCNLFTDYIISTDDEEIKNISSSYGAEVPFLRPKSLSEDSTSSVEAIKHAVKFMEKNITYDFIIELMCTNPLKNIFDIKECIHKLIKTGADSVIPYISLTTITQ